MTGRDAVQAMVGPTVRAGRCGHHFDPECQSCQTALDWTNGELDSLRAALTAQQAEIERLNQTLADCRTMLAAAGKAAAEHAAESARLREDLINTPETADFIAGVSLEATHQRERWGVEHDAGKTPFDWFWLVGYLAQKAADAAVRGDTQKAMHHTISTAAALGNWHAALSGKSNSMRPGIMPPNEARAALAGGSNNANG